MRRMPVNEFLPSTAAAGTAKKWAAFYELIIADKAIIKLGIVLKHSDKLKCDDKDAS